MVTPEVYFPDLPLFIRKTEARKRHRHLCLVAAIGDLASRLPDQIIAAILPAIGRPQRICLYPVRIHVELIGPGGLPVSVQKEADVIIGVKRAVPFTEGGADGCGIVIADEGNIEIIVVVSDERLCLHRRLGLIARLMLGEIIGPGRSLPAGIIQLPVNLDCPGGLRDLKCGMVDRDEIILG